MKRSAAGKKSKTLISLKLTNIGDDDQVLYRKADFVKAARVGRNFAFSFYQIDYQAFANSASGKSSIPLEKMKLIPVSKVVLDEEAFIQFRTELFAFETAIKNQMEPKS